MRMRRPIRSCIGMMEWPAGRRAKASDKKTKGDDAGVCINGHAVSCACDKTKHKRRCGVAMPCADGGAGAWPHIQSRGAHVGRRHPHGVRGGPVIKVGRMADGVVVGRGVRTRGREARRGPTNKYGISGAHRGVVHSQTQTIPSMAFITPHSLPKRGRPESCTLGDLRGPMGVGPGPHCPRWADRGRLGKDPPRAPAGGGETPHLPPIRPFAPSPRSPGRGLRMETTSPAPQRPRHAPIHVGAQPVPRLLGPLRTGRDGSTVRRGGGRTGERAFFGRHVNGVTSSLEVMN